MKCGSCRSGWRPGSTWAGCSLALGFLSLLEEHPRFAPRCLLDDGLCLERSFYLCVSPGWCTERCEFKTRWNKRRHKPLFLPVRDFMSFTRAIKLLSALDSCGVLPSGGDAIKKCVFLQVESPLAVDAALGEAAFSVTDDKVSITELRVHTVSGLTLSLQPSPGNSHTMVAKATAVQTLTALKQVKTPVISAEATFIFIGLLGCLTWRSFRGHHNKRKINKYRRR